MNINLLQYKLYRNNSFLVCQNIVCDTQGNYHEIYTKFEKFLIKDW